MPLNTLGLVAGISVARREGVASDQVARVALPAAIFPNLALGIIIVDRLAKDEAAAEAAAASAGADTTASTTSQTRSTGSPGSTGSAMAMLPEPETYPRISVAPVPFQVGDTLKVDAGQWLNLPPSAKPKYRWFRNEEDIDEHGTSDEYTITPADAGKRLTVEVSYTDPTTHGRVGATSPPIHVADYHSEAAENPQPRRGSGGRAGSRGGGASS